MIKLLVYLLLLFTCLSTNAQVQKLQFEYDTAGNQISRKLCINCINPQAKEAPKAIEEITENDLVKFSPSDIISYYPNPVLETLFVKWDLINDNQVNKIELFSATGQFLSVINTDNKINTVEIPFQSYSIGNYIVLLHFANGDQKSIKIIKQ